MTPIRLTVVMTHPVQYFSPWARHIAATCPDIDLTVVYAVEPTPTQQGTGFGRAFVWDVPLREGYRSVVCRAPRPADSLAADDFFGLDVPDIGRTLEATRPDLLLAPGWNSRVLVRAIRWARTNGIPLLYRGDSHLHSSSPGLRRRLSHVRARWLLRQFDAGLAVGQRSAEYLAAMGVARDAIFRSPHCVDNDFFAAAVGPYRVAGARELSRRELGLAADKFVVAFVGKLAAYKRPLDAIRAIASLPFSAALVVAGSGPMEAACQDEARQTDAPVTFVGFRNQKELGQIYGVADVLVLPSTAAETWGLVANEALASGVPIVVSDQVGCAPDLVIAGQTGETFRCGDVADLQAALTRLHSYASTATGPLCQSQIAKYSLQAATDGLRIACRRTLDARGRTTRPRLLVLAEQMVIVGGMERMTAEIVAVARRSGSPVHWLLNDWDSAQIGRLADSLDTTWNYGRYRVPLRRRMYNPAQWIRLAWDVAMSNAIVLRTAYRRRITHILLPDYLAAVRNGPALGWLRLRGRRVILRMGVAPPESPFYGRLFRWAISPFVDRIVCNSTFTERELHAHRVGIGKTRVIPNVTPTRTAPPPESITRDPHRVVFVGQLIPGKGLHLLLDAIAVVAASGRDVSLDVVADLERWEAPDYRGYRNQVQERAAQPDLAGRVRFLGAREDVPSILRSAGVHVAPSLPELREAFGLVALEAKQAGLPSIVFRSGALADLIRHEVDGWVCEEPTATALAEGLNYYLTDPAARTTHGVAAAIHAGRYDREHFQQAWADELELPISTATVMNAEPGPQHG